MKHRNKLNTYLTLTVAGATQSVTAGVVWYDGRPSDSGGSVAIGTTGDVADAGVPFTLTSSAGDYTLTSGFDSFLNYGTSYFTDGVSSFTPSNTIDSVVFKYYDSSAFYAYSGANLGASGNYTDGYANLSFALLSNTDDINDLDGVALAAFYFTDTETRLVALADFQTEGQTITQAEGIAALEALSGGTVSSGSGYLAYIPDPVPEPSGVALLSIGSAGLLLRRKRKG